MMRFDILSVFPEFFSVLGLSLVGKAEEKGILSINVHDLRSWATDRHNTVDEPPAGGGAGMVMKADVWGRALDDVLGAARADRAGVVLAIPTPSGTPLTQRHLENFARSAKQIVLCCGRYEGIDARVAEYYRAEGVQVFEYSLGDYVLNGGEVASVALIEGVARLLPGMVGNPESLVEESHSAAGLLEYPVYTRPRTWRGLDIPEVLLGGDHGKIARFRRDQALSRTLERRPDMIEALDNTQLASEDKVILAAGGYVARLEREHPEKVNVSLANETQARGLAGFARRTWPDAAPATISRADIDAYMDANLTEEKFAHYLRDPHYVIVCAQGEEGICGYTLSIVPEADGVAGVEEGAPSDARLGEGERHGPLVELSKFYIDPEYRSSGLAQALWRATLTHVVARIDPRWQRPYIWLGTNKKNKRAQKAYKRLGFTRVGERVFQVGDQPNYDVVFAQVLPMR